MKRQELAPRSYEQMRTLTRLFDMAGSMTDEGSTTKELTPRNHVGKKSQDEVIWSRDRTRLTKRSTLCLARARQISRVLCAAPCFSLARASLDPVYASQQVVTTATPFLALLYPECARHVPPHTLTPPLPLAAARRRAARISRS